MQVELQVSFFTPPSVSDTVTFRSAGDFKQGLVLFSSVDTLTVNYTHCMYLVGVCMDTRLTVPGVSI